MRSRILVVDDQKSFCGHIQSILEEEGYSAKVAHNAEQALSLFPSQQIDILLVDMKMPGMNGLDLFRAARRLDPDVSGIIMTAYGSIASAVEAIKEGVTDYLLKPFEPESLLMAVEKTVKERRMIREIQRLRKEVTQKYGFSNIIGKNHKMLQLYEMIERVAPTDSSVFITGETGVGKELVAKALHFNSPRKNMPLVAINCGGLVETLLESELFGHEKGSFTGAYTTKIGKFEKAQGSSLFLDEIGDISSAMQVKLLRVLQDKKVERVGGNRQIPVDVRIISASNQDIKEKVRNNEFRLDLFYRLNVIPIHIPPLRERVEDIPLLVEHFLGTLNRNLNRGIQGVSTSAMRQLMEYHWPGNVRELENVLERAYITADGDSIERVTFAHQAPNAMAVESTDYVDVEIPFKVARSMILKRFEKAYIIEALRKYNGRVGDSADKTGINPRTLWRKMKEYGLDRSRFRHEEEV